MTLSSRRAAVRVLSLVMLSLLAAWSASAQPGTLFVENGNVGINQSNPLFPMHIVDVSGGNGSADVLLVLENNGPPRLDQFDSNTGVRFRQTVGVAGTTRFYRVIDTGDATVELELRGNGDLVIAGKLMTATSTYPDYVFEDSYELMPLADLAQFIKTNGHLPNVPSAEETDGGRQVNMSDLQIRLLEKVEELTLYTLQQEQRLEQQQALIEKLEQRLAELDGETKAN